MLPRHVQTRARVLWREEVALAAHLGEQQQRAQERRRSQRLGRLVVKRRRRLRAHRLRLRVDGVRDAHHALLARVAEAGLHVVVLVVAALRARARHRRRLVLAVVTAVRRADADVRLHGAVVAGDGVAGGLLERRDDRRAGEQVRVRDLAPLCDAERARGVLPLHGAADVAELAVLEHEELLALRHLAQPAHRAVAEVADDVGVRLEQAYRVAHLLGEREELRGRGHVGGQAEVGAFEGDEAEEIGC